MFRIIGGVVLGFITLFVVTFFTYSGLFFGLGSDGAFHAGNFEVTPLWVAGSLVFSFIAAFLAGKVCSIVAVRPGAVIALGVVVLLLGLSSAFAAPEDRRTDRAGDVSLTDAIVNAKEPTWFVLLVPLISAAGVLLGGRRSQKTLRIKT
jgi:hypothetical protein